MNNQILFDEKQPFDGDKLALLVSLISDMSSGDPTRMTNAHVALENLKENTNFWLQTDSILQNCNDTNTLFFSLVSLQHGVKTKWSLLADEQKLSIKDFVAGYIFRLIDSKSNQKTLLSKANSILVEVVKKEWNGIWKSAIKDLVQSSYQSQDVCENNLRILKELSQDIFDFSKNSMVHSEVQQLKTNFGNEFIAVYEVCEFVAKSFLTDANQVKSSLIKVCLETMQSFLSWMPSYYILMTDLIENVLVNFLTHKRYLLTTLKCFEEVFNLDIPEENSPERVKAQEKLVFGFGLFLQKIGAHFSPTKNLENERQLIGKVKDLKELNFFEMFCQNFALTLFNFYNKNLSWVEEFTASHEKAGTIIEFLEAGLQYMGNLTEIGEKAILKTCCEFWLFYTVYYKKVSEARKRKSRNQALNMGKPPLEHVQDTMVSSSGVHQGMFNLVTQTPKPQEVLIVIDDDGIPRTETISNTAQSSMYESVKKIFINYTYINWESLKKIFNYKLDAIMKSKDFNYNKLNSLCWSCGCIADILNTEEEKIFYIKIVRMLLQFVQLCDNTNDKAIIASNIMHIVSQYKRFLEKNDEFLKTVIKKLFEFMHEKFDGVKEMASNTFLKVCQQVKHKLINFYDDQKKQPYILSIFQDINKHTSELALLQKIQFYESAATIISGCNDDSKKEKLVFDLMQSIDPIWFNLLNKLGDFEFISNSDNATEICYFLKINEKVCSAVGQSYSMYFNNSMARLQEIYSQYSALILNQLNNNGQNALRLMTVKRYRAVRKDILHLLTTFVSVTVNNAFFVDNYSGLLVMSLENYNSDAPETREAEVLTFLAKSIDVLKSDILGVVSELVPHILSAVLPMITKDFSSFPDHRTNFFGLVRTMVKECFEVFFKIPPDVFKTIIDCVIWAIKHELPSTYEVGLETLNCILESVNRNENFADEFYKFYFQTILNDILFVLLDGLHSNGFYQQCKTLYILIGVLGSLKEPLFEGGNKIGAFNYIVNMMKENFSNLAGVDHERLVKEIFEKSLGDEKQFRSAVRDYLISLNQFTKVEE